MLFLFQKESINKIIYFGFLLAFFCLLPGSIFAAPHNGEIFELAQPDGTLVSVKVFGDEFYQHVESLDGFTLIRDPNTGWINYATLQADGQNYVSSGIVYQPKETTNLTRSDKLKGLKQHLRIKGDAIKRIVKQHKHLLDPYAAPDTTDNATPVLPESIQPAPDAAPMSGNIVGLTLLIQFSDTKSAISRDEIINMLNQPGYTNYSNNGSVRDYFYDVSNGNLTYTNQVTQFVTVSKPKSYYDDNTDYGHVKELTVEALELARTQGGFDFSTCSKTGDRFYAVNIMYAGSPAAGWAKGLWPHSGNMGGAWSINGTYVRNYQMTNIGTSLAIGTFVHENGHMLLGFKDLYAYDDHDDGVGTFCVMCNNSSKNPQMFNPYFRYLKGWLNFADISNVTNGTFTCTANSVDTAYYYNLNGAGTEYFLIEARRRTGRSAALPAEGLVIWHIYTQGDNMYTGKNNLVSVEQADGRNDLENHTNTGDANDTFRSGYKTAFDDTTAPNAKYYSGVASGLKVRNVSAVGDTMTFDIGSGGPTAIPTTTPTSTPTATPTPTPTATPTPTPTVIITPTPQQNPVFKGGPYPLNGTSDYVDLPDGLTNNLIDFSVACWVKLNVAANWVRICDFGGDSNVFMMLTPQSGTTGFPYFAITLSGNAGEQGLNGTSALPTGSWQHVAVVKSGNTGILYINKVEVARNTGMTLRPADLGSTTNNYIGKSQWTNDPLLNASVDKFMFYNRAISASEVTALGNDIPGQPGVTGDVNGDGSVSIVDAMLIAQAVSGLTPANYNAANAEVNCDGVVNINDALLVARYAAGLITKLGCN